MPRWLLEFAPFFGPVASAAVLALAAWAWRRAREPLQLLAEIKDAQGRLEAALAEHAKTAKTGQDSLGRIVAQQGQELQHLSAHVRDLGTREEVQDREIKRLRDARHAEANAQLIVDLACDLIAEGHGEAVVIVLKRGKRPEVAATERAA